MENIIIEQKNAISISDIEFISKTDLSFLRNYIDFVYNVAFYNGNDVVCTCQMPIGVTVIKPRKIHVTFGSFGNMPYSKAVISSITAFKGNEELTIMLAHEITDTFNN